MKTPLFVTAITQSREPLDVRLLYSLGYAMMSLSWKMNRLAIWWALKRHA